jgi:DNA-binding NarL/FixJ family response regulator
MRVAIADDCPIYRNGLASHLSNAGFDVSASVGSADEICQLFDQEALDAVILDIAMPPYPDGGLLAAERLRKLSAEIGILILSVHAETNYALRLLREDPRGKGYLIKDRVATNVNLINDALIRISAGESAVDSEIIKRLTNVKRDHPDHGICGMLSPRELEVLRLVAEGRSNENIGSYLHISPKTVDNHVYNIFGKLQLDSSKARDRRVVLVLEYLRSGPNSDSVIIDPIDDAML